MKKMRFKILFGLALIACLSGTFLFIMNVNAPTNIQAQGYVPTTEERAMIADAVTRGEMIGAALVIVGIALAVYAVTEKVNRV